MNKNYSSQDFASPAMVAEPAVAYATRQHGRVPVSFTYNIPQNVDTSRFRAMMDSYAIDLINGCTYTAAEEELRGRLVLAVQDAREGRTMSCEEVHQTMEQKFPWLCE